MCSMLYVMCYVLCAICSMLCVPCYMFKLIALKRTNEKMKGLRDDGFVPGVVYGNQEFVKESTGIKFKKLDFERVLSKVGKHTLVDLELDGFKEPLQVIIKDVQRDFVSGAISHVDLYCVNMKKEIVTEVPIEFVGESSAARNLGGILVRHADIVQIKSLPGNLMSKIDLDVSALKTLESSLYFRDLVLPENIELITDKNRVIVNISRVKKVKAKGGVVEDKAKGGGKKKEADKK